MNTIQTDKNEPKRNGHESKRVETLSRVEKCSRVHVVFWFFEQIHINLSNVSLFWYLNNNVNGIISCTKQPNTHFKSLHIICTYKSCPFDIECQWIDAYSSDSVHSGFHSDFFHYQLEAMISVLIIHQKERTHQTNSKLSNSKSSACNLQIFAFKIWCSFRFESVQLWKYL